MLLFDGAMLFIEFSEREANVPTITEKVKQDLHTDENIILCDGQGKRQPSLTFVVAQALIRS